MCGIAGFIDFSFNSDLGELKQMTDALIHRGPDDAGYEIYHNNHCSIGLGQRRLSILDLSEKGHQPMQYFDSIIVFNGEIYNFQEIRKELTSKGYAFKTGTDTEVILAAYREWGIRAVDKFIGMFAFTLYDKRKNKIFLCRDRAGVKPLYYFKNDKLLLFSSELKSFHKKKEFHKMIDFDSLALFFQYNYIPTPFTIFKDTFKLEPGAYIEIDLNSNQQRKLTYWEIEKAYEKPFTGISFNEAVDETEKLLHSAFNYRMIADVPVGVFLSGGYDSTAVAALLQSDRTEKIKTFTIGYDEKGFNEAPEAKIIADRLGTDHTEYYCTPKDVDGIVSELPNIYDEPFADNSVVPTILVSRLAQKKVKVVLSGDGGDEIFAGYHKFNQALKYTHGIPRLLQSVLTLSMKSINPDFIPLMSNSYNFKTRYLKMSEIWNLKSPDQALKLISQYYVDSELASLLKKPYRLQKTYFDIYQDFNSDIEPLNRLLAIDYKTFLIDNNLVKMDRATMSESIEGREPFLDQRVIEFVGKLPTQFKMNNGTTKYLLKEIVHKYIDREIMNRPKMPFIAPLTIWFKDELRELLLDHLDETVVQAQGIFNHSITSKLVSQYLDSKKISHQKVWNLLVFQLWYNRWIKNN